MEKSRNFQIVYAGCTNLLKQTEQPLMKLGFPQPLHYPIGVKWVHVYSPNVEGAVFQIFWSYKESSCIQFITNEQVKLISFILEGVDFTLGILDVPLNIGLIQEDKKQISWPFSHIVIISRWRDIISRCYIFRKCGTVKKLYTIQSFRKCLIEPKLTRYLSTKPACHPRKWALL